MDEEKYQYFKRYLEEEITQDFIEDCIFLSIHQAIEDYMNHDDLKAIIDKDEIKDIASALFDRLRKELPEMIFTEG